ncbi:N-formylglutamate amidohydrolase [Sphingomonas sp.]|uniref:N-formylglutamate amidohydrolase n=1 Tax=Sphingomonas sp. TaxID=28214 RepID=UPI003B00F637
MSEAAETIAAARDTGVLIVADHASARVPTDIVLGIEEAALTKHIAVDIGVAPLAAALCGAIGCGAVLGGVSRLVCDFNREEEAAGVVPAESDGVVVPGNTLDTAGRRARIERFHRLYHLAVERAIAVARPTLLVSLHSFTPCLASRPDEARPWQVGVLYNQDDRAARIGLPLLRAAGVVAGDNQPYSGAVLNATMNRHAEGAGIAYLGLEVRQDLIGDEAGVAAWCARLAPLIVSVRDKLVAGAA